MKYIMVTDYDNHWDSIDKNYTSYTPKMLKQGMSRDKFVNGTETIFIKKMERSTEVEVAWLGKIWDIMDVPGKIFFRVEIGEEIECPEEYEDYENGWYIES